MTASELIALLEDCDPDATVMIAHQPAWPLAETVAGIIANSEIASEHGDTADEVESYLEDELGGETIWLVAGGHAYDRSPYAPREAFEEVGR